MPKTATKRKQGTGWLALILILIAACQSQVEKPEPVSYNKFDDTTLISIYEYQDRRDTRSLLDFFNDESALYREAAAEAFGSVQDSMAIPMLAQLLNDSSAKVRRAAAYALGQSYDSSAVKPLATALQHEDSVYVRRELLEAMGKVITQPQVALFYNISVDSVLEKEGLAWGLYRAGIRNVHDLMSVKLAVSLLDTTNSYETRLGAAHFLARSPNLDLDRYTSHIVKSATQDPAANVRMSSASALGKINGIKTRETLKTLANKDADYRVKVNAIRALQKFNFNDIKTSAFILLSHDNHNVAMAAVNLIDNGATEEDLLFIREKAAQIKHPKVKARLYGIALKLSEDNKITEEIKGLYEQSENPYFKSYLLTALSNSFKSYEYIVTKTYAEDHAAIKTAGISALVSMRQREDFPDELKPAFADVFQQAIQSEDVAMIAITSDLLSNPDYDLKKEYSDASFLHEAKQKLSLPKDNETLQALDKAIAYFEGKENIDPVKNEFNHPIDWTYVSQVPQHQKVIVSTEHGDIELRMLVEEAPASVVNFLKLAEEGYFNGKNFHRVVPNFVIQGGCNRGDGYGGENFSIRSELPNLRYSEGSMGMASAGKDTEGTQWFITHSPTPHLDGRYTIFAQVTDGMGAVHLMSEGDSIKNVKIVKK